MRTHDAEPESKLTCRYPDCGAEFIRDRNLREHEKGHVTRLACPYAGCTRKCTRASNLKQHITVAHLLLDPQKFPFSCTTTGCTLKFKTKSNLKQHAATHNTGSVFLCPSCKKYGAVQLKNTLRHFRTCLGSVGSSAAK